MEYIVTKKDRQAGGLNDWKYLSAQFAEEPEIFQRLRKFTAKERVYSTLQWGRVAAGAALILSKSTSNKIRAISNTYLIVSSSTLYPHHIFGTDGSDQVCFLTHAAATVARSSGSERATTAACDFLALQTSLSYVAGGTTKLAGKDWRSGEAIRKVMATETYGHIGLHDFLLKYPRLSRFASRSVMVWEATFPIWLLNPISAKIALILGAIFHLANAQFMGLGRFVLPFVGTYPSIWRRVK